MVTTDPKAKVDESPIVISEIEVDGVRLVADGATEIRGRV